MKNKIDLNEKTLSRVDEIALKMAKTGNVVKLSDTAKLGVKSWSLQAYNTCPRKHGQ